MSGQSVKNVLNLNFSGPFLRGFLGLLNQILGVTLAEQIRRAQTSSTKKQKDGKYKKHLHIAMFLSSMP